MIDLIKELWFKWRARVYQGKVVSLGSKRLAMKEKQLAYVSKVTEYKAKHKAVGEL
jgi:hypothetical protein